MMKVRELISDHLVTAQAGETLEEIEHRMASLQIHALPVLDEAGKAAGIITSSDLDPDLPAETSVGELITDQVYTISVDAEAREAARMMRDLGVHHLVAEENGSAVGLLSSFDLLRVIEEQ